MSLFFGNEDVKVSIIGRETYSLGKLDKILIATNEADIPATALSGRDAKEELKKILQDAGATAPKLEEAVKEAIGQSDNSGNKLIPSYLFVIGKKVAETDNKPVYDAIEEFDKTNQADFYGIATVFEDAKFEEWAQLYAPNHLYATFTVTDRGVTDKGKSDRIIGQNFLTKTDTEFNHIAWLARMLFYPGFGSWKFKKLNGITADPLTDGDVQALVKRGWNGYRNVRGKGQTTSTICTDGIHHADEIYLKDTIIYNVANVMMDMFDKEEIVPMEYAGEKLVRSYIDKALVYCGGLGLIEVGEDGGYLYSIYIPKITAPMKSARELTGIEFEYSPRIGAEKVVITGKEILEWVSGGNA